MKYLLIIILFLSASNYVYAQIDTLGSELIKLSDEYIELLIDEDFDEAFEYFDETMKDAFPVEKLEESWEGINKQVGELDSIVKKETLEINGKKAVILTGKFKTMYLDIRLVFGDNKKLIGFFLAPNYDYSEWKSPDYTDINKFDEEKVTFGKKGWELPGILTMPKKEKNKRTELFPVVILVHGSGPNDMDESIGPNKPFKDLAWGLATKRIAVFRYNKRTKEHPAGVVSELPNFTLKDETIDDAMEAVNKMLNMPDIDPRKIYVLGHSLGGMSIPRIAQRDRALTGFIVMAGNARPLQDLILKQYEYIYNIDNEITDEEKVSLDSIRAQIDRVNDSNLTVDTPLNMLPLSTPASYWLDIRNYFPAQDAVNIKAKMLILQGARDYQVTPDEFEIWKSELKDKTNAQYKLYPELNHLFMEGSGKSKPEEYTKVGHIPEYVIDDIVKFIKE